MGTDEYGSTLDVIQPGGQLATARVQLSNASVFRNVVENETYYIVGDAQSVTFVMVSLVTWCHYPSMANDIRLELYNANGKRDTVLPSKFVRTRIPTPYQRIRSYRSLERKR